MSKPWPTEFKVRQGGRLLDVTFDSGERFELPAPLLRVMTPAADERGHGGFGLKPLPIDASGVTIQALTPVGRYAMRIGFDDGHDTGLFTWEILHAIGAEQARFEAEHRALMSR